MPRYVLDIIIQGTDRATPKIGRFNRMLGRISQIAGGILVAGTIRGLSEAIGNLGRTAIESFSNLERMQIGIQSLIARELAAGETIQVEVLRELSLSQEQLLALDKLILKRAQLTEELSEATDEYNNLLKSEGEASLETLAASIAMRELQGELAGVTDELVELQGIEGSTATIMQEQRINTMSLADALKAAQEPAQELTDWVVRLALLSPFEEKDITTILRLAAGYGLATQTFAQYGDQQDQIEAAQRSGIVTAQRFTAASLDFTAALGLTSEDSVRLARGLLQVQAKGKLAGEEIRQLTNAGVGVDLMARAMGLTVSEFVNLQKEGKILANEFIPALVEMIERDLAGSSDRLAKTVGGTLVNMRELVAVLSRTIAGPLLTALGGPLRDLFDFLSTPEFLEAAEARGQGFVDTLTNIWDRLVLIKGALDRTTSFFDNPWEIILAVTPEDWDVSIKKKIADIALAVGDIDLGFEAGNTAAAEGAIDGITLALGAGGLLGLLKSVGPLLLRVGPAIVRFLGPIGVAAGLLGAAWSGNFLGMRDTLTEFWEKPGGGKDIVADVREWFETNIPLAIEELKRVWNEELIPALTPAYEWLRDTLIPELRTWGEEVMGKIAQEAANLAVIWNTELGPALQGVVDVITLGGEAAFERLRGIISGEQPLGLSPGMAELAENIFGESGALNALKAIGEFINQEFSGDITAVNNALANASTTIRDRFANAINMHGVIAVMSLSRVLEERLGPTASTVDELFGRISTLFLAIFGFLLPMGRNILQDLSALFEESIVPLWSAWVELLDTAAGIILDLATGAFVNLFIPKLEEMWEILDQKLNGALSDLNELLTGFKDDIQPGVLIAILVLNTMLFLLKQAIGRVRQAVDLLRAALQRLKEKLEEIKLPWWALERSPSPAERAFRNIAASLEAVNDAALLPGVQQLDRIRLDRGPALALGGVQSGAGAMGGSGAIFEGDRNVFNVDSDSQARLVAHMLRENKLKRVNEWMNR